MKAYVSLWSADLLALGAAVDLLGDVVDGFHLDVFDGHDVQDLLFGPDLVAALRQRTSAVLDVHLNVTDPDYWAGRFAEAGADIITCRAAPAPTWARRWPGSGTWAAGLRSAWNCMSRSARPAPYRRTSTGCC